MKSEHYLILTPSTQSYDTNTALIPSQLKPLRVNFVTCIIELNGFFIKNLYLKECVVRSLDPSEFIPSLRVYGVLTK